MIGINQKLILKSHCNKMGNIFWEERENTCKMYDYYSYTSTYLPRHFTAIQFICSHTHTKISFIDGITHLYQSFHILNICNKSYNVEKSSRESINDDDADIDDGGDGGDKKNEAMHCLHSLHVYHQILTV